jgi:hypothetical protein
VLGFPEDGGESLTDLRAQGLRRRMCRTAAQEKSVDEFHLEHRTIACDAPAVVRLEIFLPLRRGANIRRDQRLPATRTRVRVPHPPPPPPEEDSLDAPLIRCPSRSVQRPGRRSMPRIVDGGPGPPSHRAWDGPAEGRRRTNPLRMATATASTWECTPNLAMMSLRCPRTVEGLRDRRTAISAVDHPSAIS